MLCAGASFVKAASVKAGTSPRGARAGRLGGFEIGLPIVVETPLVSRLFTPRRWRHALYNLHAADREELLDLLVSEGLIEFIYGRAFTSAEHCNRRERARDVVCQCRRRR